MSCNKMKVMIRRSRVISMEEDTEMVRVDGPMISGASMVVGGMSCGGDARCNVSEGRREYISTVLGNGVDANGVNCAVSGLEGPI